MVMESAFAHTTSDRIGWVFQGRTFPGQARGRVGQVHMQPLDQLPKAADTFALPAASMPANDIGGQLRVPGVVVFAGFSTDRVGSPPP